MNTTRQDTIMSKVNAAMAGAELRRRSLKRSAATLAETLAGLTANPAKLAKITAGDLKKLNDERTRVNAELARIKSVNPAARALSGAALDAIVANAIPTPVITTRIERDKVAEPVYVAPVKVVPVKSAVPVASVPVPVKMVPVPVVDVPVKSAKSVRPTVATLAAEIDQLKAVVAELVRLLIGEPVPVVDVPVVDVPVPVTDGPTDSARRKVAYAEAKSGDFGPYSKAVYRARCLANGTLPAKG